MILSVFGKHQNYGGPKATYWRF